MNLQNPSAEIGAILIEVRLLYAANDATIRYHRLEEIEHWLNAHEWERVRYILRKLPLQIIPPANEYLYVHGHSHWGQGRLYEAKICFEKSKQYYRLARTNWTKAALCCLELSDIAQSQGEYIISRCYLDEADRYLAHALEPNPFVLARRNLIAAILLPCEGQYEDGLTYGQRAALQFHELSDIPTEFLCQIAIASTAFMLGKFQEATSRVAIGRLLFATEAVPDIYFARILNTELHIAWYQGNLQQAKSIAQELIAHTERLDIKHQRLYGYLLFANLSRDLGEFSVAETWYANTQILIDSMNHQKFQPWLNLHQAWMLIQRERYYEARRILEVVVDHTDVGQWININFALGICHLFAQDYSPAEELMSAAYQYFTEAGENLAICSTRIHLAYLYLRMGMQEKVRTELTYVLQWLVDHQAHYLPHWWHPKIMAELVEFALLHLPTYVSVIQRICIRHLRNAAVNKLQQIVVQSDESLRRRAREILDQILENEFSELREIQQGPVHTVLHKLLVQGFFNRDKFTDLLTKLATAERRKRPNPLVVAIFALHVQGLPHAEIQAQLECSNQSVKNYISHIYRVFDLAKEEFPHSDERRRRLRQLAMQQGFLTAS